MAKERRLKDANALKALFDERYDDAYMQSHTRPNRAYWEGYTFGVNWGRNTIADVPTVDAVEVIHAEWLEIRFDPMWRSMLATCSHCKVRGEVRVKANECGFAVPDSDYCPHCGAKMDGGINK